MTEPTHIKQIFPGALSKICNVPPLVQDTREQAPIDLSAWPGGVEVRKLNFGDYGLAGFSDLSNPAIIFERKSLGDLVGSLTHERDRFMREAEGLRRFRFAAIVIEAERCQIQAAEYRGTANPTSILSTLRALEVRAGLHVKWCGNPEGAALEVIELSRMFIRGLAKDLARLKGAA